MSGTSSDSCISGNQTNLCSSSYEDVVHTLTYKLIDSYRVDALQIYNKRGAYLKLMQYSISVGDTLEALQVCASGAGVEDIDNYHHTCGLTGQYIRPVSYTHLTLPTILLV